MTTSVHPGVDAEGSTHVARRLGVIDRWLAARVQRRINPARVRLELWDGSSPYGASKAFNISSEQLAYARERASREGLSARTEFIDDDYRNVRGEFDAFVSVGMLEHVGIRHLDAISEVLRRTVRRHGGRGLLHFIGRDVRRP